MYSYVGDSMGLPGRTTHLPLSILVVDDDSDLRESLCDLLAHQGYTVSSAADGAVALERLASGPLPNVVLLDLNMPRMDGYEFLQRRAVDMHLSSVPVVVVSGTTHAHRVPFPGDFDLAAVLRKPFDAAALFQLLQLPQILRPA